MMKWLLFLLLVQMWASNGLCKMYKTHITRLTPKKRRQWGGTHTNTGKNFGGWLVRITNGNDGTFACGGAYYAPLLVITSGNCIEQIRNSLEGATADGTAIMEDDEENNYAAIDTIYTPDSFTANRNHMDIAVVRLLKPIRGRLTEFIKLCDTRLVVGMRLTAFAWGYETPEIEIPTGDPKNGTVTVVDLKACRKTYANKYTLTHTALCVQEPKNRKNCRYEGGGPLVWKNQLCGVVSLGPQCGVTMNPGIYTNINQVKKYIEDIEKGIIAGSLP